MALLNLLGAALRLIRCACHGELMSPTQRSLAHLKATFSVSI